MEGVGWIGAIIIGGIAGWPGRDVHEEQHGRADEHRARYRGRPRRPVFCSVSSGSISGGWIGYLIAGFIGACILIAIARAVSALNELPPGRASRRGSQAFVSIGWFWLDKHRVLNQAGYTDRCHRKGHPSGAGLEVLISPPVTSAANIPGQSTGRAPCRFSSWFRAFVKPQQKGLNTSSRRSRRDTRPSSSTQTTSPSRSMCARSH